ncbi:MAG: ATP-grasp domain-containing protein [Actinomycetota bacterium]
MASHVTFIHHIEDFLNVEVERKQRCLTPGAHEQGISYDFCRSDELLPMVRQRPSLLSAGIDLLAEPRCFAVSRATWNAAADRFLKAIYDVLLASDSVLLNHSLNGPDTLEHDKLAICAFAKSLDIPTIDTYVVPFGKYALRVLAELPDGPEWIVKPRDMGMGMAVLKAQRGHQLQSALDLVSQSANSYIIQPFILNQGDLRVYVIDGQIEETLLRRPPAGDYISNVSHGASRQWGAPLPADIAAMSLRISQAMHASYLCIDWLLTDQGPLLSEWCTVTAGISTEKLGHAFFAWVSRRIEERNA